MIITSVESVELKDERFFEMVMVMKKSIEEVLMLIKEWGIDVVNRGYDVFDFDGTGLLCIETVGEISVMSDEESTKRAVRDGVYQIIPVEQLPINMPKNMRFYGWIDTEENRINIAKYCYKLLKEL